MTIHQIRPNRALDDGCPPWCSGHVRDDEARYNVHSTVVGVADHLEISLVCYVFDTDDPVTELELRNLDPGCSGTLEPMTLAIGPETYQIASLLALAVSTGR